jgi:hypothetical protein
MLAPKNHVLHEIRFFFHFCDVATLSNHPQEDLAKFGCMTSRIVKNITIMFLFSNLEEQML